MQAGTRGPDGDGVFVFVGGSVKARWREQRAREHVSSVENFPVTARRSHLDGMFGPASGSDFSECRVLCKILHL